MGHVSGKANCRQGKTTTNLSLTLRLGQGTALAALLLGLPASDAAVPVGANEDVGGRAPSEAGDAVGTGGRDVVIGRGRHGVGSAGCWGGRSEGGHGCLLQSWCRCVVLSKGDDEVR